MTATNADMARIFEEIADLLELEEQNPFRVRAYRNAARIVGGQRSAIATELERGRALPKLPGIGKDLSDKMREIAATGDCKLHRQLKKRLPAGLTELLRIPGLGAKRVRALWQALDVTRPAQLQRAALAGELRRLPGFGAKIEQKLLEAAQARLGKSRRFSLAEATRHAEPLVTYLRDTPGVSEVVVAGSFRRRRESVGDLDILVVSRNARAVVERFGRYPEVRERMAQGTTRASAMLKCGLQVDLRIVPKQSFGAALHYFTGSKAHNIAVRRLAQARGLKVNEYGVFRGKRRIAGETEASVYAAVGLAYIEPGQRENEGEFEAARRAGAKTRSAARKS